MLKEKSEVKPGDIIHIYRIFGHSEFNDTEGVVTDIDGINQIYGTWGYIALLFDDDWEIIG